MTYLRIINNRVNQKKILIMNGKNAYTRSSVALLYFPELTPEQAVRRLTRWIKRCKPLYAELTRDGRTFDRRQILTVREAKLIMEHLGEP